MPLEPSTDNPQLPQDRPQPQSVPKPRGDALASGCLVLSLPLLEAVGALMLALALGTRGWARSSSHANSKVPSKAPAMDWVPVFWLGGFTLVILAIAVILLRSARPYSGALQLLIAGLCLAVTITVGNSEYERAHPAPLPPCPTAAGTPCEPDDPASPYGPGGTSHQCRSGGNSDECANSGR
ncbi:DUF6234 family protein [Streptomyces sp. NPDC020681]|uniref:DUF6234 family protein n=1 Tax=Streptomyces sp. NPDC020681 TaxID=3365083 RepID=UPI003788F791